MVHVRKYKTYPIAEQIGEWQNTWQKDLEKMMEDQDIVSTEDDYEDEEDYF